MYGAQLLGYLGDHAVNLLPAGDVGNEWEDATVGLAAQLAGSCLQISLVARNDRHLDPFPGQLSCDGLAGTATSACHDGPLALQSEVHGSFSPLVDAPVFRSNQQALFSHQARGASATPVAKSAGATNRDGPNRRLAMRFGTTSLPRLFSP